MSGGVTRWVRIDPLRAVLSAIGVVTVATGLLQIAAPGVTLGALGALERGDAPAARQLIATVGMFMVVVGGLTTQVLVGPRPSPIVIGWSAAQKLGAAGAVGLAVLHGVFAPVAGLVASFDLLTAVLLVVHAWRLRHPAERPARSGAVLR